MWMKRAIFYSAPLCTALTAKSLCPQKLLDSRPPDAKLTRNPTAHSSQALIRPRSGTSHPVPRTPHGTPLPGLDPENGVPVNKAVRLSAVEKDRVRVRQRQLEWAPWAIPWLCGEGGL
ncbi:hypothetical protein BDY21DRAFT_151966 [Lineolata rhizophorae]|uniref:Uncharacterized protein n=1 Tax=Lineolata rhizophorae TaxID=578093 RepID=A0A6A6NM90_9PEZI|nr:hypothetical protein BDY21DRAFT_151966 [Lineolata rhizophorae]